MSGVQVTGIVNVAADVKGVQISGIVNKAKALNGFQIGLINVADSVSKGGGLGLLNFYKKGGYREWEISASDFQNIGISFKSGTNNLYTIFTAGYNFIETPLLMTGAGIGSVLSLKKNWFFKPEIVAYNYVTDDFNFERNTGSYHVKLGLMRRVNNIGITLMPSVYYANTSSNAEGSLTKISPIEPLTQTSKGRWGVGIGVGLSFLNRP
jgi:hypothetical protein